MQRERAYALRKIADETAALFSRDRAGNTMNETFKVERIEVLSESTALVTFMKSPTNKRAAAWFYFVNSRRAPRWEYFFITYQHLASLDQCKVRLFEIEQHNFEQNFSEPERARA